MVKKEKEEREKGRKERKRERKKEKKKKERKRKKDEFTVVNSLTSICFYDSLGKGGSLLLCLFAIIFILLILRKRFQGGKYITKMLLPAYRNLSGAPANLWKL